MDITQILLAAQSPDGNLRSAAEGNIKQFQEQNLPNFLLSLSVELSNDERPPESRRLAGIILKNSLDAKDSAKKELLIQQWVSLDPSIKLQIKESLLITLGSSVGDARQTSSQVIAKIASIEIPRREWQDLIAKLLSNMTQPGASAPLKQATLEALGYVCEEIPPEHLEQDQVNAVLTAVVQGMNQTELSSEVRLAAVKALYNALDFAESNFANEMERTFIMKVICDTAVSKEVEIRQAAFECLVAIASTYYVHLDPYMQTIFNLTANAVKGDEEPVALQAVEFWSTICEEEIELQEEYEGSDDANSTVNYRFIEKALPSLVPMLLETLLKQEEDQEQDDNAWNISMSGGTCLGLIARTVGDAIVPLVMPFVEANITKPDWRCREAATFAFGSILDGPSLEKLAPLVQAGLDFLLNTMNDPNSQVKDTTAWTLGRVFELLHSPCSTNPIISNANLPRIMAVLLESSKDVPNVAEKVCGAIYFLAQGYEDAEPASSLLTPYLPNVIAALLTAADRGDMTHVRLRASAYEALNEIATRRSKAICRLCCVVYCSATVHEEAMLAIGALAYATGPDFVKYMPEFFKYLEAGLQNYEEYQVCSISVGVVGDICRALEDKILPFCDGIMTVLLKDLSNSQLNRSVKPPIFSCFGDIALAIGENFEKYLPYAMPMLQGAAELLVVLDQNDEDMVDYGNQLRRGIFEAYSGILQGIKGAKAQLMIPYAGHLLQFTEAVYKDRSRDESVTKAAVAVLGDLADTLGPISKDLFKSHLFHVEFLRECLDLDDEVRETASWTQGMINQAIVS
ncbi:hypothetical protein CFC21_068094 [Triticum aestivum]|uniref:Importin N-terminal domain-containing protein n=3 Tax=Triticum TaxID=4564 RepID=A0A341P4T8_WHEAT|nr:hypothetical protein CFC21_007057 [Triticum aestivum]KAF6995470.1 hypothetical protein CFC21_011965 [Triticum aestivum]KAF7061398.1 hypothetical protein CFC21_068094 [Triticum aestivum]VAH18261.1 unnamed protein product [Triticum turgidum subsp. durum]